MKLDFKTSIILLSILVVSTVGSAFVTTWVFNVRTPPESVSTLSHAHTADDDLLTDTFDPRLTWNSGTLTVNLASVPGGIQRFVKTKMNIYVSDSKTLAELQRRDIQIKDRIITVLRTTLPDQLVDEKGIFLLKERIKESVQELVSNSKGQIRDIYLTELVIQ